MKAAVALKRVRDYTPEGWLNERIDPNGKRTWYFYNNAGELTRTDYETDLDVVTLFDNLGRQTSRVDAAGTWAWTYDGDSSRILSETLLPSVSSVSSVVQYSYVPATKELASVGTGAHTTEYAWAAGRLTNVSWEVGTDRRAVRYGFLPGSDLLLQTVYLDGTITVYRAYDQADRLLRARGVSPQGKQ